MKIHLKKLNQRGFDHVFLAVAFIVVIGVIGTATLLITHGEAGQTLLEAYNNNSGTCLTADGASVGSTVVIEKCAKTVDKYQDWTFNSAGSISAGGITQTAYDIKAGVGSNLCLDNWKDLYESGTNSNPMKLYGCSGTDNAQRWIWGLKTNIQPALAHQLYNIGSYYASKGEDGVDCLDVLGGTGPTTDDYTCKVADSQGFANQEWFEDTAPTTGTPAPAPAPISPGPVTPAPVTYSNYQGTLQAYSNGSGHCVTANSTIELTACSSSSKTQSWKFDSSGSYTPSGTTTAHAAYYIVPTNNSSECLTIVGSAIDLEGTCGINPTQRWYWGGVGGHQLINPATNKCLDDYQGSSTGKLDLYACKSSTQSPSNQEWFE